MIKKTWKRIALCVCVFSLMGGSLLFADSVTQKIRVWNNGKELADGGYLIDGKTYIPARAAGGLVSWDNSGRVTIVKPNVDIILLNGDKLFGNVNAGKLKLKVLCQVDSLAAPVSAVKVTISDPSGNEKDLGSDQDGSQKDNFWFATKETTYDFKESGGKYTISFYMKGLRDSDYTLIAEKVVTVLN
ncbi:copper amine oxidase [Paenibacillus glufosinatiresistens]|uniref:copper amine oxidase n=1 Tax=Paenibacillus glufosinatiresistens TaxID=3070657 RepID=UPI00286E1814|nr:copper amine oxidase [Paenibacillus sp. YX.27]